MYLHGYQHAILLVLSTPLSAKTYHLLQYLVVLPQMMSLIVSTET